MVLTARREDRLKSVANELTNPTLVVPADLLEDTTTETLVLGAVELFGCIDILLNSAGDVRAVPALDESPADVEHVISVNVMAPLRLAQLTAREMAGRDGGVIVNVASIAGLVGMETIPLASYGASKSAP